MHYTYKTSGVCSRSIDFDVENGVLKNVKYVGGCDGNLKGIGKLVEGMDIKEVAKRLDGIKCGFKATSCPDQLSKALQEIIAKEEN